MPAAGDAGPETDARLMARAVDLARSVRRHTAPNPWVGAVVAHGDEIVGEGATSPPGGPHAEIHALRAAGARARGATLYTTLEPCSHHGRTPPCVDAVRDAGVARVVVALEDPDPNVAGRGIAVLRDAGITVDVGAGAHDARASLAAYLHHRRTGRAYALLKTATSVDGRVAAADGTSRWITGPDARRDAHELRADSQAVLVGAGTALADEPSLTVRDVDDPPRVAPVRVVVDARGRVPATGPLFDTALAPTLVVTTDAAPTRAVDAWRAAGAKVELAEPSSAGAGVDLAGTLAVLGGLGVLQVLVEGGPTVHASFLEAGLADALVAYVAPVVIGDRGRPAFALPGAATIGDASQWQLTSVTRVGNDARLDLTPTPGAMD